MAPTGPRRFFAERPAVAPPANDSEPAGASPGDGRSGLGGGGRPAPWEQLAAEFPQLIEPDVDLVDELEQILRSGPAEPPPADPASGPDWSDEFADPTLPEPPAEFASLPVAGAADLIVRDPDADATDVFDETPATFAESGFWRLDDAAVAMPPDDGPRGRRRFDIAVIGALVVLIASAGAYSALRGFGPSPAPATTVSVGGPAGEAVATAPARADIGLPVPVPTVAPPTVAATVVAPPVAQPTLPTAPPETPVAPEAVVPNEGMAIRRADADPPAAAPAPITPETVPAPDNPAAATAAPGGVGGPLVAAPDLVPIEIVPAVPAPPAPATAAATPAPVANAIATAPPIAAAAPTTTATPPAAPAPATTAAATPATGRTIATTRSFVNMRAAGDNAAPVLMVVAAGTPVEVVRCFYWCEVVVNGRTGWIFQDFLAGAPRNPP